MHDNQCLGYGIAKLEQKIPLIVTLHHPITRDRMLEMEPAPNRYKRLVDRPLVQLREDAGQGRLADAARRRRAARTRIQDIHTDMGVALDRMRLVPVGVDPDLFKPVPGVARIPGRLITTASADVALKGQAYLIEAMAKLRADGHDITLTIIGKPKPGGKSLDLIEQYGLRPHIDFVSGVTDERIVELYSEAELAVVPSLYEGFSLPAIEAMCSGTPLVATDGGALPEVTGADGETVFRCRKGDAETSPRASAMRWSNPSCAPASARPAGSVCSSGGRWRRCAELTVEQYREVLAMPQNVAKLRRNGRLLNVLTIRFDELGLQRR